MHNYMILLLCYKVALNLLKQIADVNKTQER